MSHDEGHRDRDRGDRDSRDDRDGGYDDGSRKYSRFEKPRPPADLKFDYKDIQMLRKYLSEHAKIVPSRITRLNATQQRALTLAIKRARHLGLLPCSPRHMGADSYHH
jgi:small subunit ribosomal protein S18